MSSIAMAADSTQMVRRRRRSRSRSRNDKKKRRESSRDKRRRLHRSKDKGKQKPRRSRGKRSEEEDESSENESDLDLTKELQPISSYVRDPDQMVSQMFSSISNKKLKAMLPPILKNIEMEDLKKLCVEQLEGMSRMRICKLLEGVDADAISSSGSEEESEHEEVTEAMECSAVDSTSALPDTADKLINSAESSQDAKLGGNDDGLKAAPPDDLSEEEGADSTPEGDSDSHLSKCGSGEGGSDPHTLKPRLPPVERSYRKNKAKPDNEEKDSGEASSDSNSDEAGNEIVVKIKEKRSNTRGRRKGLTLEQIKTETKKRDEDSDGSDTDSIPSSLPSLLSEPDPNVQTMLRVGSAGTLTIKPNSHPEASKSVRDDIEHSQDTSDQLQTSLISGATGKTSDNSQDMKSIASNTEKDDSVENDEINESIEDDEINAINKSVEMKTDDVDTSDQCEAMESKVERSDIEPAQEQRINIMIGEGQVENTGCNAESADFNKTVGVNLNLSQDTSDTAPRGRSHNRPEELENMDNVETDLSTSEFSTEDKAAVDKIEEKGFEVKGESLQKEGDERREDSETDSLSESLVEVNEKEKNSNTGMEENSVEIITGSEALQLNSNIICDKEQISTTVEEDLEVKISMDANQSVSNVSLDLNSDEMVIEVQEQEHDFSDEEVTVEKDKYEKPATQGELVKVATNIEKLETSNISKTERNIAIATKSDEDAVCRANQDQNEEAKVKSKKDSTDNSKLHKDREDSTKSSKHEKDRSETTKSPKHATKRRSDVVEPSSVGGLDKSRPETEQHSSVKILRLEKDTAGEVKVAKTTSAADCKESKKSKDSNRSKNCKGLRDLKESRDSKHSKEFKTNKKTGLEEKLGGESEASSNIINRTSQELISSSDNYQARRKETSNYDKETLKGVDSKKQKEASKSSKEKLKVSSRDKGEKSASYKGKSEASSKRKSEMSASDQESEIGRKQGKTPDVDADAEATEPGSKSAESSQGEGGALTKTQLEILELEMRARAIKAMLKAQVELEKHDKKQTADVDASRKAVVDRLEAEKLTWWVEAGKQESVGKDVERSGMGGSPEGKCERKVVPHRGSGGSLERTSSSSTDKTWRHEAASSTSASEVDSDLLDVESNKRQVVLKLEQPVSPLLDDPALEPRRMIPGGAPSGVRRVVASSGGHTVQVSIGPEVERLASQPSATGSTQSLVKRELGPRATDGRNVRTTGRVVKRVGKPLAGRLGGRVSAEGSDTRTMASLSHTQTHADMD